MAGSRNPRIPEWSSGGSGGGRDSNRRPATGRLPRRTTGAINSQAAEQPVHSSFIPDEFKTEEDLPLVVDSAESQNTTAGGRPSGQAATELHLPVAQDEEAIVAADTGPGQVQMFAEKYELLEKVGEGGMGSVYKAHNRLLNVDVALKVLTPEKITSPDVRERFLREARATQMFRHRHAIAVQEVGELSDGTVYLTMDFSSGENLDARIKRLGRLSLDEAILITLQVLDALAEAHRTGIVHRDLKPGNIMVEISNGRPSAMVVDFGIAKILQDTGIVSRQGAPLTSPGLILGTVEYMSPEQAGGAVVDARSDIYSMGAVLYHMLTGQLPSQSEGVQNMIINIMFQPPKAIREIVTDGTIPPEVEAVVMKALSKSVDERYQSAHEFGEALRVASADYLPDDTRTQSSSFRLPTAQQHVDPNSVPTMHLLPPLFEPAPEAAPGFHMGAAQKWLAAVAVVLLLGVVGLAVWKKTSGGGGSGDDTFQEQCRQLEQAGEWDKLRAAAMEAEQADSQNSVARRFRRVADMEIALREAATLGTLENEAHLSRLQEAERQLRELPADDPANQMALTRFEGPLAKTRALLEGMQKLKDADRDARGTLFAQALESLDAAEKLFQSAAAPIPERLGELRIQARRGVALQKANDACRQALTAESATPPNLDLADTQWSLMLEALREALLLEPVKSDGTLTGPLDDYRKRLADYVRTIRTRSLRLLPVGAVGDFDSAELAQMPDRLDRFSAFLVARQSQLELPLSAEQPFKPIALVDDGAFQAIRDECNLKWTDRLVSEGDWQLKLFHLDLALALYNKALTIALPEAVPVLRKKIEDASALQAKIDDLFKAAMRAHQNGQVLEAMELLTQFLQTFGSAPQAEEAAKRLKAIQQDVEKANGFKVSSSPLGAEVYLNGSDRPAGRTPMLLTGDHGLKMGEDNRIELRMKGFETVFTARRFTGRGLAPIDFSLQPKRGRLVVRVGEPNVLVILTPYSQSGVLSEMAWDKRRTNPDGESTWDEIPVGKWQVDIQPPTGFTPVQQIVEVLESDATTAGHATVVEQLLQAAPATLVLRTQPPNLKVLVNGQEVATRTPVNLELPAGAVRVVIVGEDGFELPLDFELAAGDAKRPEVIQFNFETERQKGAWAKLKAVLENDKTDLTTRVAAQLTFLNECGSHARAGRIRVDLDELVPAHLRNLKTPAEYLAFVSDYAQVCPKGKFISQFRSRVNTMLFFPFVAASGKGYQAGTLAARAANGLDYLLRWGDNGLQVIRPDGIVQTVYSGFSIHEVRAVQGADDILWMRERADDAVGRTRRLSRMIDQQGVLGSEAFLRLNQDHYAGYGLISSPYKGMAWFAPVTKGRLPDKGVFSLAWDPNYEAHILPNGNTLLLSSSASEDGRVATTLQVFDSRGDQYKARQLVRETLDPISSAYRVFRISPEGSMAILRGNNNKGEDDYRVVRTSTLNANYYAHVGRVRDIFFGHRGTRLVVHGMQGVEVYEVGGLNAQKRMVPGVFETVQITPDDQYLILARQSDFILAESSGNVAPRAFNDMRLLAVDSGRERILCSKDRDLHWVYWRSGELVKITDLDSIWRSAHGARLDDPAPRMSQVVSVRLLNGGHAAFSLPDGSILYFDLTAPQRMGDADIQLLKRVREQLK